MVKTHIKAWLGNSLVLILEEGTESGGKKSD